MYRLAIIVGIISLTLNKTSAQWVGSGSGIYGGPIQCMAIDSVTNRIYVGTFNGIYTSADAGQNWSPVSSGLSDRTIHSIAINRDTLYAGTSDGLYRSTDYGSNWLKQYFGLSGEKSRFINSIAIDDNRMYIGAWGDGVFQSNDYGKSWRMVNHGLPDYYSRDDPSITFIGDMVFVGFFDGGGIYSKSNEDTTWTEKNNGLSTTEILCIYSKGNNLFAGTRNKGVFFSNDLGNNWASVNDGFSIYPWRVNALVIKGDMIFAGTDIGIFTSPVNDISWEEISVELNTYSSTIWFDIFSRKKIDVSSLGFIGDRIFVGTQNGIHASDIFGDSWTALNNGINNIEVNSLAASGNRIFVGTWYNGIFRSMDNGQNWIPFNEGLKTYGISSIAINNDTIFAGADGGFFRSDDNGETWNEFKYESKSIINISKIEKADNYLFLLTSSKKVYRSYDNGSTWIKIDHGFSSITDIFVVENEVFLCNYEGIFVSSDYGESWVQKSLRRVNCPTVYNSTIYAADMEGISVSFDLGEQWSKISNEFQNNQITSIAITEDFLFASTSSDLYVSDNKEYLWRLINDGLPLFNYIGSEMPFVSVNQLVPTENYLFAGTMGGVWKLDYSDIHTLSISEDSLEIGAHSGSSVSFEILSNTAWTVSSNQSWLALSNESGQGNSMITLTAESNTTYSARFALVTVSASGFPDHTIYVLQDRIFVGQRESVTNHVEVYPNPANNSVIIRGANPRAKIRIYSLQGSLILDNEFNGNPIDISHFGKGIYLLRISNDTGEIIEKIIKL